MRTNEILYISNFKFSKNIKLIFLKIPSIFLYLYLHGTTLYYLDKILPPTIRTKINATLLTIPFSFFFRLHPHSKKKKKRKETFSFISHPWRDSPLYRGRNRSIFSRGEEKATTFRKGAFSREESCYPRVITPLGGTTRSRHMRAKLVPVPLSLVVSPWFMYLCISTQPLLLD